MPTISATGLQSLKQAAGAGDSMYSVIVRVCRLPNTASPVPIPYPNASSTSTTLTSSAEPAAQKGIVTRECWAAALEGAVARAYRAQSFDLDSQMRSLWTTLEEIRRNRAALDATQVETRLFTAISNVAKTKADISRNSITNVR